MSDTNWWSVRFGGRRLVGKTTLECFFGNHQWVERVGGSLYRRCTECSKTQSNYHGNWGPLDVGQSWPEQ